jgi:regulator of RNase E activity RraA
MSLPSAPVAYRPGFVAVLDIDRPPADLAPRFLTYAAANVSDVQGRQQTMHASIKAIYQPMPKVCGPAITVKARPGDNLMAMKAIEAAQPGDVIVISSDGEANLSVWGGIMSSMAVRKGIAAVVTDGVVRDLVQTREVGFRVWATGCTPAAPTKDGPGQLNTPITCGNVLVFPGDLVFADEDGVVVIRRQEAAAVLERAQGRIERERGWLEHIGRDDFSVLVDTDDQLRARGCLVVKRADELG